MEGTPAQTGAPDSGGGQGASPGGGPLPPAAWYPDPEVPGRQRYWDGAQWTEHVHPPAAPGGGGAPGGDPLAGAAQSPGAGGGADPAAGGPEQAGPQSPGPEQAGPQSPHPGGGPQAGSPPPYAGGQAPPSAGTPPYPTGWDPNWAAAKAESDARQWAMFAHLSALAALIIGLPFVGPLIIYLTKKDSHPFIADHAREALNFNISVFIYELVTFVLIFVLAIVIIGFFFIPVAIGIAIAWLVFVILAAVKANAGQPYRYPLTIRMVS